MGKGEQKISEKATEASVSQVETGYSPPRIPLKLGVSFVSHVKFKDKVKAVEDIRRRLSQLIESAINILPLSLMFSQLLVSFFHDRADFALNLRSAFKEKGMKIVADTIDESDQIIPSFSELTSPPPYNRDIIENPDHEIAEYILALMAERPGVGSEVRASLNSADDIAVRSLRSTRSNLGSITDEQLQTWREVNVAFRQAAASEILPNPTSPLDTADPVPPSEPDKKPESWFGRVRGINAVQFIKANYGEMRGTTWHHCGLARADLKANPGLYDAYKGWISDHPEDALNFAPGGGKPAGRPRKPNADEDRRARDRERKRASQGRDNLAHISSTHISKEI